jgi:hypothetical protein
LVRATGVESQNGVGQIDDTQATKTIQPTSYSQVVITAGGHVEARDGHQKDTFGAFPCRAGVEGNGGNCVPADLLRLAMLWDRLPIEVRHGWVITAEAIIGK